jgi:hypothetical protein
MSTYNSSMRYGLAGTIQKFLRELLHNKRMWVCVAMSTLVFALTMTTIMLAKEFKKEGNSPPEPSAAPTILIEQFPPPVTYQPDPPTVAVSLPSNPSPLPTVDASVCGNAASEGCVWEDGTLCSSGYV